jgi:oligoendopeptidase F
MAPLPLESHERVPWADGQQRVRETFARFYPALAEFATSAFERQWIDWSPRAGKRPGGFCSTSSWINESRVFITYNETLGDLSTLAHELGHAFHGKLMSDMRPWSRRYPMTLAETASTFAEQLVIDAVLEDPKAPAEQRALLLDARMQDAATFLLNIPMRFYFETSLYQERAAGEVSLTRMQELMLAAQRRCYGDALADDELDPWFWASKLHFYITGLSFYNFPYTFGYLFSMGIFARAKQEGPSFLPRYEELLRRTGSDSAEGVAREALGVDLEEPDFWSASIDLIDADAGKWLDSITTLNLGVR